VILVRFAQFLFNLYLVSISDLVYIEHNSEVLIGTEGGIFSSNTWPNLPVHISFQHQSSFCGISSLAEPPSYQISMESFGHFAKQCVQTLKQYLCFSYQLKKLLVGKIQNLHIWYFWLFSTYKNYITCYLCFINQKKIKFC
jgi:hypothetical protein